MCILKNLCAWRTHFYGIKTCQPCEIWTNGFHDEKPTTRDRLVILELIPFFEVSFLTLMDKM